MNLLHRTNSCRYLNVDKWLTDNIKKEYNLYTNHILDPEKYDAICTSAIDRNQTYEELNQYINVLGIQICGVCFLPYMNWEPVKIRVTGSKE